MGHDTGRMKTGVMKTSLCGRADPDGGLDADRVGGEDIGPRRVAICSPMASAAGSPTTLGCTMLAG